MNKKQIINLLEERYVKAVKEFDEAMEVKDTTASTVKANISCEIAEILAEINGTGFDYESERLYKKYNLYKEN